MEILTSLASSEKDKELIRMATCQSQRLSSTQARKIYGMENYTSRKKELDSYIKNAEQIRKTFEELTILEEDAYIRFSKENNVRETCREKIILKIKVTEEQLHMTETILNDMNHLLHDVSFSWCGFLQRNAGYFSISYSK